MLLPRILTALVLLPIVVGAVFFLERNFFACFAGLFFLVAGWEWSRLIKTSLALRAGWLAVLLVLMAWVETGRHYAVLWPAAVFWLLAVVAVLSYPRSAKAWFNTPVMMLAGWLVLVPSFLAVVKIQAEGVLGLAGPWALLFILAWVWAADTGAYFAGRAFGKHKLAPAVSPGKTWQGLVGGVLLALLVIALVTQAGVLSFDSEIKLALVAIFTILASVFGDLVESMVKREAGVKDSGNILPGHGGMLDRIDSVTSALPVALVGFALFGLPGGF